MTTTHTATVETMTAEVHVLKVGSRQVTLSVAKQLDLALVNDMKPMGRIRTVWDASFLIELIGRHSETGALVRAFVYHPNTTRWLADCEISNVVCRVSSEEFEAIQALPLIVLAGLK